MGKVRFTKMHGCGNDYVYVDCTKREIENPSAAAKAVSDRHFGIGSDGLILICASERADFRMDMYNADGSQGEMCGNGIRCVGKYVYDHGLTDKKSISVETRAGIKHLDMTVEEEKVTLVRVDMGSPIFEAARIPADPTKMQPPRGTEAPFSENWQIINEPVEALGKTFYISCISMGNPHMVIFVEDTAAYPVEEVGRYFEHAEMFPERTNVEFVQILSENEINMRVWERGAGETWACGTGSCAAAAACVRCGYTEDALTVHLLGGDLKVEYDQERNTVWMTGPAVEVFEGEIEI